MTKIKRDKNVKIQKMNKTHILLIDHMFHNTFKLPLKLITQNN